MSSHRASSTALALSLVLLTGALLSFVACSSGGATEAEDGGRDPENVLGIVNSRGEDVQLSIEIAATPQERNAGLSGRTGLDENAGMLFVFQQRGNGFWMKDTTIPLSVAFIGACGDILHIADMEPLSLQLINPDVPYGFGLEVNQGWFARNEIAVGDRVVLPDALLPSACGPATGSR